MVFGDDYTATTVCIYPGAIGGTGGDCARAFLCVTTAHTEYMQTCQSCAVAQVETGAGRARCPTAGRVSISAPSS